MKGKNIFTKQEFEELKSLIRQRLNADKSSQKQIRKKMRAIGFFGRDDFGIVDCHISDLESLVRSGIIKVIGNKVSGNMAQKSINNKVVQQTIKDKYTINPTDHTQNKDLKTGLEPWVGGEPKVLILGSLPGDESIKQQTYYAKKQNAFWKIMRTLFDNNIETDNKKFIISCGIALWDCVHSAIRKGSLDSAIKDDTVVANDIKGLIAKYPTINTIILNGGKAEKYYKKYCKEIDCATIRLISTSPAATKAFEEKLKEWSIVKDLTK